MKAILAGALAITMTGCATMADGIPADERAVYRAIGTEPFWSLTIGGGRMVYEAPGHRRIAIDMPQAQPFFSGRRYTSTAFMVEITPGPCSDGMSDRSYPDVVRITFPDRRAPLSGCGGPPLAPATLADTNWAIVEISGARVSGERYSLSFDGGRISGQAGCNRFSGGYRQNGETLTIGALAMTRMACPGPGMAHEQRFSEIMRGPVRISFPDGDTLLLTGAGGEVRARRAI